MTNGEYIMKLSKLHTDAEAQKQVIPLWQDFVQCRISAGDYDIRLRALHNCIIRCRGEEAAEKRPQEKLARSGAPDLRGVVYD